MSKTVVARRSKRLMGMKTKEKKGDGEMRFEEEDAVENVRDLKRPKISRLIWRSLNVDFFLLYLITGHFFHRRDSLDKVKFP